jgi:hypothetical protein
MCSLKIRRAAEVLPTPPTALDPPSINLEKIMTPIITHPAQEAHPDRDAAARKRANRLAKATADQMQAALAYLSIIDSEAFEIAFTAVAQAPDDPEDEEPTPLCATCGAPVGIFPEATLNWLHFRGATTASGIHETYDPGHACEVAWYLPDEAAEEF